LGKALVLNATYQPLCVVPVRRAICLVLKSKAVIEHTANADQWHSEKLVIDVPSVVRLKYFVKVPYRARTTLSRRAVFIRDAFECQYCGAAAENVDHVTPRSKGGAHTWENVVASCRGCNARKENRSLREAGLKLRRSPAAPRDGAFWVLSTDQPPADWAAYLNPHRLVPTAATANS
jgi:5-methylcytosine-specific restriction endonuclease McrA